MDFLPQAITGFDSDQTISRVWQHIYGLTPAPSAWLGLNLQWPKFDLPLHRAPYFISWHTEYMDVEWLLQQSRRVYPSPMINITDWPCDLSALGMDNIQCLVYDTFAQQISLLKEKFGCETSPSPPVYKISSLSNRFSQYKKFVTAYLLNKHNRADMVLSWYNWICKDADTHGHPKGFPALDLDYTVLAHSRLINLQDETFKIKKSPVDHGDWHVPAYQKALINLTNESWHYSGTTHFGHDWIYPGPYLTEKTMKPLVAGRPFLAIGQSFTYDRLQSLGFSTNFGLCIDYDKDAGDLTRISKIFDSIDMIFSMTTDDLWHQSIKSCQYNLDWINSGDLDDHAWNHNQNTRDCIRQL